MIVVANTDVEWFKLLRQVQELEVINFWRPGSQNFKALAPGEIFYFMLKRPIRKIGGYGEFKQFDHLTIKEAWDKFGLGNGVTNLPEFQKRIEGFEKTVPGAGQLDRRIGCIQLTNCVFLDDTEFKTPEELGIEFANSIVAYKTYPELDMLQI